MKPFSFHCFNYDIWNWNDNSWFAETRGDVSEISEKMKESILYTLES